MDPFLQSAIGFAFGVTLFAFGIRYIVPWADRVADQLETRRAPPPAE